MIQGCERQRKEDHKNRMVHKLEQKLGQLVIEETKSKERERTLSEEGSIEAKVTFERKRSKFKGEKTKKAVIRDNVKSEKHPNFFKNLDIPEAQ